MAQLSPVGRSARQDSPIRDLREIKLPLSDHRRLDDVLRRAVVEDFYVARSKNRSSFLGRYTSRRELTSVLLGDFGKVEFVLAGVGRCSPKEAFSLAGSSRKHLTVFASGKPLPATLPLQHE